MSSKLIYEVKDRIAYITINRRRQGIHGRCGPEVQKQAAAH
jgi:hypothetical protein